MNEKSYTLNYANSRALIIGLNKYCSAPHLEFAVNDAKAIAKILIDKFNFKKENVIILLDKKATRSKILSAYLSWANGGTDPNDRLLFYFAGHGYTTTGRRGEVGYLVPFDGNPEDLSSLIRWEEITKSSDLIDGKHILFLMDACYGGLALTRSLSPGSMRYLKDMQLRYSRQVLTAGKADEQVADSGGPIPDHSIFTGHLLQALEGEAVIKDEIITANSVMAYVTEKVSRDNNSIQTPHYGYLEGDGDFIFKAPVLELLTENEKIDSDILITIPVSFQPTLPEKLKNVNITVKEYLSDNRYKIQLHDLVVNEIRTLILLTSEDNFPVLENLNIKDDFLERLKNYEKLTETFQLIMSTLSYWGTETNRNTLSMPFSRIADSLKKKGGLVIWLALKWYPICLLTYTSGISAIANSNYDNLFSILMSKTNNSRSGQSNTLVLALGEALSELNQQEVFKMLPGHERNFTPLSEYLLKLLQPVLDDNLYLGGDYESHFNRFEVLMALIHADLDYDLNKNIWGPIGRFGWKERNKVFQSPFSSILLEAESMNDEWEPLKAGFFNGKYSRFKLISEKYLELIGGLHWIN
ncbi:MAG: peptidase C14 caspase catalytic subunit p20 [Planctomycetota bacterium]|nr:MAG: peptidase C14 caspase catalytic subunit p20 [Planctomycetota bacterium]